MCYAELRDSIKRFFPQCLWEMFLWDRLFSTKRNTDLSRFCLCFCLFVCLFSQSLMLAFAVPGTSPDYVVQRLTVGLWEGWKASLPFVCTGERAVGLRAGPVLQFSLMCSALD